MTNEPVEQRVTRGTPFGSLLGIRITSAEPARVTAEMPIRDEICTVPGIAHGGALMSLADTVGATATVLNLPPNAGTTTLESKTNFFAPAPAGTTVQAECLPLHRGRRTMVCRRASRAPRASCWRW